MKFSHFVLFPSHERTGNFIINMTAVLL